MGEAAPILIGFGMVWFASAGGFMLMIASVILFFAYRHSRLPALMTALLATVTFVVTDLLFVWFNFTGGSWTALFDITGTVLTGSGEFVMETIIAIVMVLTALSMIYSIFILIIYMKQKNNKPMEAKNG